MPHLILADKSDLFRRSITSILTREGYEVTAAENGNRVLQLCAERLPDAIILDTETPEPSGLETLLMLKKDPKLRRLPVIVVSRDSAPSAVSNAFKVGAESFMLKPIDLNALLKALDALRTPIPTPDTELRVAFGPHILSGPLRFIDKYGMLYMDRGKSELEQAADKVWDPRTEEEKAASGTAIGMLGTVGFKVDKKDYTQLVMLAEQNEQGAALFPVGKAGTAATAELLKLRVNYKARYMVPGSFMKLVNVDAMHARGFHLTGLTDEPRFNSEVQVTLYPQSVGAEGGIALAGKITSSRSSGDAGFDIEVELTKSPGSPYVDLLAELIGGRPPRVTP